jgi:hypothetical protein
MVRTEVLAIVDKMGGKSGVGFNKFEAQIIESAESCPTEVIKYE